MLATTPRRRGSSLTRRAVSAFLALIIAAVGAIAGLIAVAGPASAGAQATCSWTELVGLPQGIRAAEFSASTDGWLVLFADGVRRDDQSMWLRGTIKQADADFAAYVEADLIEWRWYDPAVIDSESLATITHATPFVCDFNWPVAAPAAAQSIDFTQPADVTHGQPVPPLVVSASSGLPVTTESLAPDVCTVDGVDVTLVGIGECTIEATQDGGVGPDEVTYAAASPVSRTFNVNAGALHQDVQFTDPLNMRLGEGSQVLLATADSEGPIWFESLTPEVCIATNRASNSTVSADALGVCTVRAHQSGGPVGDGHYEYNAASADKSFHVWPAALDQTIAFPELDDVDLGDSAQSPAATATSGLDVSYRTLTPETCSVTGGQVASLAVGTCTIEATQAGNADVNTLETVYNAAEPVTRSFEIAAAPIEHTQQVTVAGAHGYPLSKRTAGVRFTSSAGLPVTVTSQTPKVCTVAKNAVALKSAGTCTLTAIAAGNATYAPSEQVEVTFGVWAAPKAPAKAPAPRAVTVLGKGEGAYRVTATPAKVCGVVRGKAVLTGAGRCTIVVRDGSRVVRRSTIAVTEVNGAKPSAGGLERIGSVRFAFNSAKLTPAAKKCLRSLAPKLRKAELIVVYGNTQAYGGGDNPANRKLSAKRAAAVVKFLRGLRVKAKATTVATSSRNPLGKDDAANRRADVYWLP
ncbi:OmpA family protein [Nocardioides dubius]|uniref:OmpA-like domain-containing protein n=1 Tax=Nocardioides dubius TaxID=317019 RepID=A0ABN1TQJ8_9ACTN